MDQARFFQYQFQRLGAEVQISINEMDRNSINLVFGAHGGFYTTRIHGYRYAFVNLEQLGNNGASVHPSYLDLLSKFPVIDYDPCNVAAYRSESSVPIVSFGYAPYLATQKSIDLDKRPIELLFFGSINERRRQMLLDIHECGIDLSILRGYGQDRDEQIARARAVFNCHYYDSARFEQARVFQCLSVGTPVISELTEHTSAPPQFKDSVFWLEKSDFKRFFYDEFRMNNFLHEAKNKLSRFCEYDVIEQYSTALRYVQQHAH
ncbi:hypothetical protein [Paraburkholderia sp. J76]|uniref:hypothetical protein n=1 Tax=Paraburkholderia sp. J76 TaxID=2805439 RepID=UPI002ABD9DC6|nr:hypothetical protein [Paraburkholderia sp. J76]